MSAPKLIDEERLRELKELVEAPSPMFLRFTRSDARALFAALEAAQEENQELRRAAQDEAILKTRLNAVSAAKDAEIEKIWADLKHADERAKAEYELRKAKDAEIERLRSDIEGLHLCRDTELEMYNRARSDRNAAEAALKEAREEIGQRDEAIIRLTALAVEAQQDSEGRS